MRFIKSLFCKHDYQWLYNIHGDMINIFDGKRSIHECRKCGKTILKDELGGHLK